MDANGFATAIDLAEKSGESYRTIDLYTNLGLLNVSKRKGRTRLYEFGSNLKRLKQIRSFQDEGYTLLLIRKILDLEDTDERFKIRL